MEKMSVVVFVVALGLVGAAAGAGPGNSVSGPGAMPAEADKAPVQVRAWGSFARMQHRKDFEPKVMLKEAVPGKGWYAIGALADLKGEITVHDGAIFLAHGKNMDGRISAREVGDVRATLLAAAKVDAWREFPVPTAMKQADLHAFIVERARSAGLDVTEAFPFQIHGEIRNYRWHVIAAPNPHFGGHGGNAPMAEQFEAGGERMVADVVGFYSGDKLSGVISHPGEMFHEHLLDPARTVTGHLDAYDVGSGAVLSLPASVPAASSGKK